MTYCYELLLLMYAYFCSHAASTTSSKRTWRRAKTTSRTRGVCTPTVLLQFNLSQLPLLYSLQSTPYTRCTRGRAFVHFHELVNPNETELVSLLCVSLLCVSLRPPLPASSLAPPHELLAASPTLSPSDLRCEPMLALSAALRCALRCATLVPSYSAELFRLLDY